MKLVHDINGEPLKLLKTRLLEVEGSSSRRWTLTFKELRRAVKRNDGFIEIEAFSKDQDDKERWIENDFITEPFSLDVPKLGCRTFSQYTFNKILKAAGVKRCAK